MDFTHIIVLLALVYLVDARRIEGEDVFDLAGFLEKVLKTVKTENFPPPAGGLSSKPLIDAIQGNTCKDVATWCSDYKNHCKYEQVYNYCKETCGKCSKPKPPTKGCEDTHSQCDKVVEYGYCTASGKLLSFAKKYCQRSCGFCKPCNDKYSVEYCKKMLDQGYCKKVQYQAFFKNNCERTCGYCDEIAHGTCGVAKLRRENKKGEKTGIVGGQTAEIGFYPWQVAIYNSNKFICGGTLISQKYILTAAHCFNGRTKDVRKYKVVLGDHNRGSTEDTEATYYLQDIKIHKGYTQSRDDHDIALLEVVPEVRYTDLIQPACLPSESSTLPIGTKCYISGWGKTSFDGEAVNLLQELKVPVAEQSKCKLRNAFNFHVVSDSMICTGVDNGFDYSSGCHGDSGGPLSCERSPGVWTLEGVVSWGSPLCNGLDRYTVFTRVSSYKDWIDSNTM